ncbi:MAG: GGDEF domain-containing protein [Eggerthellaceae bacterium]|nr:GGDEF domain-containing protein [Eggerthellaceae bacterium]
MVAAVLAIVAIATVDMVYEADGRAEQSQREYAACTAAAFELQNASDCLTSEARLYVVTGNRVHLDKYLEELNVADHRGKAVETIRSIMKDAEAAADLNEALEFSNRLAERELYAMRLRAEADGLVDKPAGVSAVELRESDVQLSAEGKVDRAVELLISDAYDDSKSDINERIDECLADLMSQLQRISDESTAELSRQLDNMHVIMLLLLGIIVLVIFAMIFFVLWPSVVYARHIQHGERLELIGAYELKRLVDAYNDMHDESRRRTKQLEHDVVSDPLTGLLNRGAYDAILAEQDGAFALLIIDIDNFKGCNDTYGHDVGDSVLKKVARVVSDSFRSSDHVCRIGGDEFVVIMTNVTAELRDVVARKVEAMAGKLADGPDDGLPRVTLSVGIAFSDDASDSDGLYRAADHALYEVKGRGRNGYAFFETGE